MRKKNNNKLLLMLLGVIGISLGGPIGIAIVLIACVIGKNSELDETGKKR